EGSEPELAIQMAKVSKWYGDYQALHEVDLDVRKGERIVICGPSGSGKSTLIRCINQLEEHQGGKISVGGTELNQNSRNVQAIRRDVGMVFQNFNLFPHLTVLENCMLAPVKVRGMKYAQAEEHAMKFL